MVLPRSRKHTIANSAYIFLMESLRKFDLLNFPALMFEYVQSTMIERKGKLGMGYVYFLTEVFDHLKVAVVLGNIGIVKQFISFSTWSCVNALRVK